MSKKTLLITIVCLILSSVIFFFEYKKVTEPQHLYRVYLAGDTIGYIKDKNQLEKYIDNEQIELKEKYKVDKVYPPNDLDIVPEVTFNKKISTEKDIYNKIKDISHFSVSGYIITIKGVEEKRDEEETIKKEDKKIYVIDKNIFTDSIKDSVLAFISEEDYNNFKNGTQKEIVNVGSIIEDLYIENVISIKEGMVSTNDLIFTNSDELKKYLLFGTTETQKKYTVADGDTISDIADKNKLSVMEFLVANPDFTSANNLLYKGQQVNVGLIDPLFRLVEVDHEVSLETQKYEIKVEYDNSIVTGYERVKQEGIDGITKVTKKIKMINGVTNEVVTTNTEIIKKSQPKIIVKGTSWGGAIILSGEWAWPAAQPSSISRGSGYQWRGSKFHEGIDISGPGLGSPIYAANSGVVKMSTANSYNGNYVVIDHGSVNGVHLITYYGHLSRRIVKAGDVVNIGQQIGMMGATGYAFGVHLHFGLYHDEFAVGRTHLNPCKVFPGRSCVT